ncbi:33585_t:CDS:2 [Gigaspora margarita]|uniref:33585_t:CDS:1 n=1 Tax=Gigaspora margarita TaxID=4874 RepID=A0ABN7UUY6_GIGMA|nr:33585_t:CDS:2 [Gigaspora margarita]
MLSHSASFVDNDFIATITIEDIERNNISEGNIYPISLVYQ